MTETSYKSLWGDVHRLSFRQAYVQAGSVRTRYIQAGESDQPVLIFLHGTGGHAEAFLRNLEAHAEHFCVYSVDYLGHGWTDRPDVAYEMPDYTAHLCDVMDALNIESASLCGESMGGWIAASFALAHSDRVDKLILNTMGGTTMRPEVMATVYDKTMAAVENPAELTRPRLEWLMADPAVVTDDLVACRQRIYEQPGMKETMRKILCLQQPKARERNLMTEKKMRYIKASTLVLWTSKDPTAEPEVGERIASWIPGARYTLMRNCGHWPQYEDPENYNRICLEFLLKG